MKLYALLTILLLALVSSIQLHREKEQRKVISHNVSQNVTNCILAMSNDNTPMTAETKVTNPNIISIKEVTLIVDSILKQNLYGIDFIIPSVLPPQFAKYFIVKDKDNHIYTLPLRYIHELPKTNATAFTKLEFIDFSVKAEKEKETNIRLYIKWGEGQKTKEKYLNIIETAIKSHNSRWNIASNNVLKEIDDYEKTKQNEKLLKEADHKKQEETLKTILQDAKTKYKAVQTEIEAIKPEHEAKMKEFELIQMKLAQAKEKEREYSMKVKNTENLIKELKEKGDKFNEQLEREIHDKSSILDKIKKEIKIIENITPKNVMSKIESCLNGSDLKQLPNLIKKD